MELRRNKSLIIVLISTLLLANCSTKSYREVGSLKNQGVDLMSRGPSSYETDLTSEVALTCDDFLGILKNSSPKPTTVLQALELLRQNKPEYLKYNTFVFESRSLHETRSDAPRALVYGTNAKFVLSFNGERNQAGFERLELMCFRDVTKSFEFIDVAFPREAQSRTKISDLTDAEIAMPFVISPINGTAQRACTACHQNPARPNWDTYPHWPGVYGSNDDSTYNTDRSGRTYQEIGAVEKINWTNFYGNARKRGRYAMLGEVDLAHAQPNATFGILLNKLNGERIVRELTLKGAPFWALRYKFLQALYCPSLERINGGALRVLDQPFQGEEWRVFQNNLDYMSSKTSFAASLTNPTGIKIDESGILSDAKHYYGMQQLSEIQTSGLLIVDAEESVQIARIEKLLKPIGIDVSNWSQINGGGYQFSDGLNGAETSLMQMLEKSFADNFLAHSDTEIANLIYGKIKMREAYRYDSRYRPREVNQKICQLSQLH